MGLSNGFFLHANKVVVLNRVGIKMDMFISRIPIISADLYLECLPLKFLIPRIYTVIEINVELTPPYLDFCGYGIHSSGGQPA